MRPVWRSLIQLVRLGRPLFLVGGFLFHGLGVAIALYEGAPLSLPALLWGQVAITAIQTMTHYSNDYFDQAADRANLTPTFWAGGSGVLPQGELPPRLALLVALIFGGLALLATLLLALAVGTGPLTAPLLLLALFLAWEYSAPPLRLHSRGVGELTVAFLVPVLTPLVGYYLQAGRLGRLPFLATAPLALFQFAMLLAIEFPDAAGDAAVGKRTLVVRLGPAIAGRLLLGAHALAFLSLPLLVWAGLPALIALLIALFSAPISLWFLWRSAQGVVTEANWWSWLAFLSVALLMGTAAVELVGFVTLVLLG